MQQIARLSLLVCILFSLCLVSSTAKICKDIHVGTDTKSGTINDIIAEGETSKLWMEDTDSPVIVTHSKKLEYFYMINLDVDLSSSNVKISYDNEQYANSTVNVKEEKGKKHWYTLEVLYNCEAYGGALLSYKLEIDIPDCGTAEFHWKKVCGYPLTPRDGFTIDMTYGDEKTTTIVKNGLPIPGQIYDPEIKDFSIEIPPNVNYAKFELYMNPDDIKDKQSTASDDSNVDSALASIPETTISAPKVDSDDAVATVTIDGSLVGKGGVVKKEKSVINMNFTCEGEKDFSTVEFVIPMTNFRDINLFFYKECDGAVRATTPIATATATAEEGSSWLFWIFVALLSYLAYQTFVNYSQGAKGLDAVPFITEIRGASSWAIQSLSNANKNNNSKRDARPARSQDDDEEKNDFNIKNIAEYKTEGDYDENKYGTI